RLALLPDNGPARCLYCGADLPPAPVDQPARTTPGTAPAAPAYSQSAPQLPGAAMPPGYPAGYLPTSPPPGYGQMPSGYGQMASDYGQVPPGYGVAPPGFGPMLPGTPGAAPIDPRMQPAPGYPYGYPAYPPAGPGEPYPYPYGAPAPYPYGYPGAPIAQPAAPVKRRRRWLLVSAILLLVVLLLGGGGAAAIAAQSGQQSAQPTASAAPPAPTVAVTVPAGFTAYQDPTGLFAVAVPSGWQQLSSSSGGYTLAQFADPTQRASITVEYTADTSTLNEQHFDDQILTQLTASLAGATLTNKKTLPQISTGSGLGNASWASEGADLTFTSGGAATALHVMVQTTSRSAQQGNDVNDYLVATLFVAPSDSFASLDTRYFQPAQNSFAFAPQ
ncbi:MAG TPA: hypothetical protein VGS80_03130, partial [Ktedonobacterales bacterium]|nr:hypothetical protein [Ktedonobacterales bacterium]